MAKQHAVAGTSTVGAAVTGRRGGPSGDVIFRGITLLFAVLVLVVAGVVVVTTFLSGWDAVSKYGLGFLTSSTWNPITNVYGAQAFIFGTIVTSIIALILAGLVGVGVALLLVEVHLPRAFTTPISFLVELLAAIPSIVFGVWGLYVLIPFVRESLGPALQSAFGWVPLFGPMTAGGASILACGLVLAMMIVPTVSAISRDIIRVVPDQQREAALALGATRWEMIRMGVLPYARSGIIGALILALGRAVGETIAATMVIGNQPYIGPNLLSGGTTLASKIADNFGDASGLAKSALFELGLILFVIAILLNAIARLLVWSVSRGSAQVA